jgi:hypothetical protein
MSLGLGQLWISAVPSAERNYYRRGVILTGWQDFRGEGGLCLLIQRSFLPQGLDGLKPRNVSF